MEVENVFWLHGLKCSVGVGEERQGEVAVGDALELVDPDGGVRPPVEHLNLRLGDGLTRNDVAPGHRLRSARPDGAPGNTPLVGEGRLTT